MCIATYYVLIMITWRDNSEAFSLMDVVNWPADHTANY